MLLLGGNMMIKALVDMIKAELTAAAADETSVVHEASRVAREMAESLHTMAVQAQELTREMAHQRVVLERVERNIASMSGDDRGSIAGLESFILAHRGELDTIYDDEKDA